MVQALKVFCGAKVRFVALWEMFQSHVGKAWVRECPRVLPHSHGYVHEYMKYCQHYRSLRNICRKTCAAYVKSTCAPMSAVRLEQVGHQRYKEGHSSGQSSPCKLVRPWGKEIKHVCLELANVV